ncbi:MAG: TIM barrel protein [Nanoarchaeota archaeon]|nr:TIM barrel protein [Nanoarchaeota archaeon]
MIKIGPAGLGPNSLEGLQKIKELNLTAAEIEFTHSIYLSNSDAKKIGDLAKKLNISLSVHAPYYINLSSTDKEKIEASKKRILKSCERANYLNAKYVVFHPGFYQNQDKELVYQLIKKGILELQGKIKNVKLAPETTGKHNVFGSLDEILRLVKETKCHFCIDFAHLYSRNNGKLNYNEIFKKIKHFKEIHAHFSGIEYNSKGEVRHEKVNINEFKKLLKAIPKNPNITIINESPYPLEDAVKMLKLISCVSY